MAQHALEFKCLVYHREAEERRQAAALEKQQAAEARERELAAQRAQREAERQALRKLQRKFAVRMEGFAAIEQAPKVLCSPETTRPSVLHSRVLIVSVRVTHYYTSFTY